MQTTSRHLSEVEHPLEKGVYQALYRSAQQRRWRALAVFLLGLKHILRGLLFSWPLYLLGFAAPNLDHTGAWWLMLLLIPAVSISATILWRGLQEDYANLVKERIFKKGHIKQILVPADP